MINTLVTRRRRTLHNYTCFICCKLQTRLSTEQLLCCFAIDDHPISQPDTSTCSMLVLPGSSVNTVAVTGAEDDN